MADCFQRPGKSAPSDFIQISGGDRGDGAGNVVNLGLAQVVELDAHGREAASRSAVVSIRISDPRLALGADPALQRGELQGGGPSGALPKSEKLPGLPR